MMQIYLNISILSLFQRFEKHSMEIISTFNANFDKNHEKLLDWRFYLFLQPKFIKFYDPKLFSTRGVIIFFVLCLHNLMFCIQWKIFLVCSSVDFIAFKKLFLVATWILVLTSILFSLSPFSPLAALYLYPTATGPLKILLTNLVFKTN